MNLAIPSLKKQFSVSKFGQFFFLIKREFATEYDKMINSTIM
jgi:hypothetical protein